MHPAKAIGWNEMPFGRDTHVVPNSIFILGLGRGDFGVGTPNLYNEY